MIFWFPLRFRCKRSKLSIYLLKLKPLKVLLSDCVHDIISFFNEQSEELSNVTKLLLFLVEAGLSDLFGCIFKARDH